MEQGSDLFSSELEALIKDLKEDYENWTRGTPERYVFDLLVRRAETAVVDYWEEILEIIAMNIDFSKDVELRFDMLSLVEHLLLQENLHSTMIFYTEIMIKLVLLPCFEWRPSQPVAKIRKASVICMMKLLEKRLIEKEKFAVLLPEIINKLKSPLDDDWGHDLRFAAVVLLHRMLEFMGGDMEREGFQEIYPELLKRLDDAQDGIRVETCKAFEVFFEHVPDPWSSSLYSYTIKQIFIHIDDPNTQIQNAITSLLQKGCTVQTEDFIEIARENETKFQHALLVKNCLDFAIEVRNKRIAESVQSAAAAQ